MPRRPNNITISLPQEMLNKIEELAEDGESIGLCVKRLLLALLGESPSEIQIEQSDVKRLDEEIKALRDRLESLEIGIEREVYQNDRLATLDKTIQELSDRLEALETEMEIGRKDTVEGFCTKSPAGDGLTSAELARKLGKHPSTVLKWREREAAIDPSGAWRYRVSEEKWFPLT